MIKQDIRVEKVGRRAAGDERQDNVAVRSDRVGETCGRAHFSGRKVIEGEGYENNFTLRHGMVVHRIECRCPPQGH